METGESLKARKPAYSAGLGRGELQDTPPQIRWKASCGTWDGSLSSAHVPRPLAQVFTHLNTRMHTDQIHLCITHRGKLKYKRSKWHLLRRNNSILHLKLQKPDSTVQWPQVWGGQESGSRYCSSNWGTGETTHWEGAGKESLSWDRLSQLLGAARQQEDGRKSHFWRNNGREAFVVKEKFMRSDEGCR